jgi:hypothetical protein
MPASKTKSRIQHKEPSIKPEISKEDKYDDKFWFIPPSKRHRRRPIYEAADSIMEPLVRGSVYAMSSAANYISDKTKPLWKSVADKAAEEEELAWGAIEDRRRRIKQAELNKFTENRKRRLEQAKMLEHALQNAKTKGEKKKKRTKKKKKKKTRKSK